MIFKVLLGEQTVPVVDIYLTNDNQFSFVITGHSGYSKDVIRRTLGRAKATSLS